MSQEERLVLDTAPNKTCFTIMPFTVRDADGKILHKGKINLGLDLQGGQYLGERLTSIHFSFADSPAP